MASKERFVEVAETLRKARVRVSYRNVNDVLTRDGGVGLSFSDMKPWLREWIEETGYDVVVETAKIPDPVRTKMVRAVEGLWSVARDEAKALFEDQKRRIEAAMQAERALCDEAAALADAKEEIVASLRREMAAEIAKRDEKIRTQQDEISWYAGELDTVRAHLQAVRADDFWERVVQEIHAILPEQDGMHIDTIMNRVGTDLVQEARGHREEWKRSTVKWKITQRINHRRLFARDGDRDDWFRRRRPEDDRAA